MICYQVDGGASTLRAGIVRCILCITHTLAITLICGCGRETARPEQPPPEVIAAQLRSGCQNANLVICLLDAARPDHMGCYGYPRATTPNIDRLAEESLIFDGHYCQATYTGPSTACLFTGQYPETNMGCCQVSNRPLPEPTITLLRVLEGAGFRTALFSSNVMVAPEGPYGNGGGFRDSFTFTQLQEMLPEGEEQRRRHSPEPMLRLFGGWLQEHKDDRFFAYIHFTLPHSPYRMPLKFRLPFERRKPPGYTPDKYHPGQFDFPVERENIETPALPGWINLYDANFRYADWAIAEVERMLRKAGVFEKTLFIVTSDHGEAFGEHGWVTHGAPWHEEVTHIPLIMRFPSYDFSARHISALTESVDVLPTVFDIFQIA